MNAVRRLGSVFVAFISGAVLATGLSIVTTLLLDSQRPARFGLVLASGLCVVAGSVFGGWLAVIVGDLEALERNERSEYDRLALWRGEASRIRMLVTIGLLMTFGGVLLLPARLLWTGWSTAADPVCQVGQPSKHVPAIGNGTANTGCAGSQK